MVKIKTGFYIRADKGYTERKKIYNYKIAITPFDFKDNYENFPNIDYNKYSTDYLVIDTKIWALMLRDLPRSVYSMAMQIAYILESNTNLVKITQQISSAIYSRNGKPARYWTTVINILEEYGFLAKTNRQSTYIINHNIIFKGDLNAFAKEYKALYGNYKGVKDKKGKVIIDKNNFTRVEYNTLNIAKRVEEINYRANKYTFKPTQTNDETTKN